MYRLFVAAAVALATVAVVLVRGPSPLAAQCCGDCSGDGTVSIDEIVVTVNHALAGCGGLSPTPTPRPAKTATRTTRPTPTPTSPPRCSHTFQDSGNNLCTFSGRFNLGCGTALRADFNSNGTFVVVTIYTQLDDPPTVQFSARVDGAAVAALTGWSTDRFQTIRATAGSLQLTGNGQRLVLFPNDPPFMIQSCNFVQYGGDFIPNPRRAGRVERGDDDEATAFQGLLERLTQKRPPDPIEIDGLGAPAR